MKRALIIALIVVAAIVVIAAIAAAHNHPRSFLDRYMQCVNNASTYAAYEACGSPDQYGTP